MQKAPLIFRLSSGDVDDIRSYESEDAEEFSKVEAYMQSKLCLLLYTRYLARQVKNATVLGVDPGASTETLFNRHKERDSTSNQIESV